MLVENQKISHGTAEIIRIKIHLIKREEAETMEIGKKWVKLALLAKKEMEAWRGRRIVKKVIMVIYGDYDKG